MINRIFLRLLTLTTLFASPFMLKSQEQLPNASFENWINNSNAADWNELSIDLGIYTFSSAEKTSDAAFGSWAAKLQTKSIMGITQLPGFISLGNVDLASFMPNGGIPFTSTPTGLAFSYKYFPQEEDSMIAYLLLTRWNTETSKTDTIGGTILYSSEQVNSYTRTTLPVYYMSFEQPDTINVGFVSSGLNSVVGSTLYVDSVELVYETMVIPTLCLPATEVTSTSFKASWIPLVFATGYILDIAYDEDFTNYLDGYEHKYIEASFLDAFDVVSNIETSRYFYRVKVIYDTLESLYSNTISVELPTVAIEATEVTNTGFIASWLPAINATSYLLDIAYDQSFIYFVEGYENLSIQSSSQHQVTELDSETQYFYRVRVVYGDATSMASNTVSSQTLPTPIELSIYLLSPEGTNDQTVCVDTEIDTIIYLVQGFDLLQVSEIPDGLEWEYDDSLETLSIFGSPTESGVFQYFVTVSNADGTLEDTGSIVVVPNNNLTLVSGEGSENQSVCVGSPIQGIVYSVEGVGSISLVGLPQGIGWEIEDNLLAIEGVPSETGTFDFVISLAGGCGEATLFGSINVFPLNTIEIVSGETTSSQDVCIETQIELISYITTGATDVNINGLPEGIDWQFVNDTISISGDPAQSGFFTYTISLMGGCGNVSIQGSINVSPMNSIYLFSDEGTDNQEVYINSPINDIVYQVQGAEDVEVQGLPFGVSFNLDGDFVTISGNPEEVGVFGYIVALVGGCGIVAIEGTITVSPQVNSNLLTSAAHCLELFPNPARGFVNLVLHCDDEGLFTFFLINAQGATLERGIYHIVSGNPKIFETHHLPKGVYILGLVSSDGLVYKKRFVKD